MAASPTPRLWHLESFSGGLDRRDGSFSKNQNRFYDLVNYRVQNNKRLKRRAPCDRNETLFVNSQGCIEYRGALYTVAKKGDAVTKPAEVTGELRFDNPDHCTNWELVALRNFSGTPLAVIKHTYPGGTVTHQYRLHVFDGKKNKPTYVEDPWCPIGWGPTLPLHLYRTGEVGAFDPNWVPQIQECSGRLYMSRPDGNLAFCKTGNPRVWNDRTVEDLQEGGEWWYFITNSTSGVQDFIVSEPFDDLFADNKWCSFILEYLDSNGAWQQFTEDDIDPTNDKHWRPVSTASRFAGGPNEITARIYWTGSSGTPIRFRLVLDAALQNPSTAMTIDGWGRPRLTDGALLREGVTETYVAGNGFQVLNPKASAYSFRYKWSTCFESQQTLPTIDATGSGLDFMAFYGDCNMSKTGWNQVFAPGYDPWDIGVTGLATTWWALRGQFRYNHLPVLYVVQPTITDVAVSALAFGGGETTATFSVAVTAGDYVIINRTGLTGTFHAIVKDSGTVGIRIHDELDRAGNWTGFLGATGYNWGTGPTVTSYGFDNSRAFYINRTLEYQLNLAGADDAGDLPTASQQGSDGGYVTAMSALKDRLMVIYKGGSQLWTVSGLPEEHALLGFGPVGSGDQVTPLGAVVGQSVVIGMARGMMSLNLSGSNLDSLRDINLGEPIEELGRVNQFGACFWPRTGQYVTAVEMLDDSNARQFLVFDYSPEQKINAWSRWTVTDLPAFEPNSLVAQDTRLYFRAGGRLHWFDLDATDYIDVYDDPEDPYVSEMKLHYNHFEAPFRPKQAIAMEWVMKGEVEVSIRWNPDMPDEETGEVVYTGMTAGRAKVPVSVWGNGLAPVVRSQDRTGHEIEELGMWFLVRGR